MGFGSNDRFADASGDLLGLDWASLGLLVQSKTLDAVARHFLDLGLTELCIDALTQDGVAMTSLDSTSLRGEKANHE